MWLVNCWLIIRDFSILGGFKCRQSIKNMGYSHPLVTDTSKKLKVRILFFSHLEWTNQYKQAMSVTYCITSRPGSLFCSFSIPYISPHPTWWSELLLAMAMLDFSNSKIHIIFAFLFCVGLEKKMESFPPGLGVKGEVCWFWVARQSKSQCDTISFKGELMIILAVGHSTDTQCFFWIQLPHSSSGHLWNPIMKGKGWEIITKARVVFFH